MRPVFSTLFLTAFGKAERAGASYRDSIGRNIDYRGFFSDGLEKRLMTIRRYLRSLLEKALEPIRRHFREVAPFCDKYDLGFAGILGVIVILGYATYMETPSLSGLVNTWPDFIGNSGLLALLTAWTAIIGLYRLRHRPDKNRPSVREDFNNLDGEGPTDFGLRNFGPESALYVQAVATVEQKQEGTEEEEVARFQVHDSPIHLREGDFASLVLDVEEDWVSEMTEKYDTSQPEGDYDCERNTWPKVNFYFSYVSQSGARTPIGISTDRPDDDILDKLKDDYDETRRIELWRVVDA